MDQKTLITLTKFSRSEISRNLAVYREQDYTNISKKEYLKSRIYYMESISLYILDVVLKINFKIISWKPIFEKMLKELELIPGNDVILKSKQFLANKISEILNDISNFKKVSERLSSAQKELQIFLRKTTTN